MLLGKGDEQKIMNGEGRGLSGMYDQKAGGEMMMRVG
jgi:hypothetical protein